MFQVGGIGLLFVLFIFLIWIWNSLYIIKEWERGVVLRLGRLLPEAKSAGLNLVFWPIETLYRINMRLETLDVPPQDIITRDNVSVKVNAVCYFRVVDANLACRRCRIISMPLRSSPRPRSAASLGNSNWMKSSRNAKK